MGSTENVRHTSSLLGSETGSSYTAPVYRVDHRSEGSLTEPSTDTSSSEEETPHQGNFAINDGRQQSQGGAGGDGFQGVAQSQHAPRRARSATQTRFPLVVPSAPAAQVNSLLTMPNPRSKLAPEKFRGDYHKVKEFVLHFERLCAQHNVTRDIDKCDAILRYCSSREKTTIKNMGSYIERRWEALRRDILALYDADLDTKRYCVRDLRAYVKRQRKRKVKNLGRWKGYIRKFLRIGGSLKRAGRISELDYAGNFWKGIHPKFQSHLDATLRVQFPMRNMAEPYPMDDVNRAAEHLLQRDRFDRDFVDSDYEDKGSSDSDSNSSDSDDSSDSESSDSESEAERKRKKYKGKSRRSKVLKKRSRGIEEERETEKRPKKRTVSKKDQQEVMGMIKQMKVLALDDPEYGLTYYQALHLDPMVAEVCAKPALRQPVVASPFRPRPMGYAQNFSANTTRPPVSGANSIPIPRAGERRGGGGMGMNEGCFACKQPGHQSSNCPSVGELTIKGELTRDNIGRVTHADGSMIRRQGNESIIEAYERERGERNPARSHLIMIADSDADQDDEWENGYATDMGESEDDRGVFAIQDMWGESYGVERPERQIAAKRKQVLDGVYVPRLKDISNKPIRAPVSAETGRQLRPTQKVYPRPPPKPRASSPAERPAPPEKVSSSQPKVVPVDVEGPRFDASRDENIIEDARKEKSRRKAVRFEGNENASDRVPPATKRHPRQSELTAGISSGAVLEKVLSSSVTLELKELMAMSADLAKGVADKIKVKSFGFQPVGSVGLSEGFPALSRTPLIKTAVQINKLPVKAIVDTGSMLNVVSEQVWKDIIQLPIDFTQAMKMRDANGGESLLAGLVEEVPIMYGGIETRGHIYVSQEPDLPFDLLLGRPWQRGNRVGIEEDEEGTHLIFRDPETKEPRFRVLVSTDESALKNPSAYPPGWLRYERPTTLMVSCAVDEKFKVCDPKEEVSCPNMEGMNGCEIAKGLRRDGGEGFDRQFRSSRKISEAPEVLAGLGEERGIKEEEEKRGRGQKPTLLSSIISFFKHTSTSSHSPDMELEMELGNARARHENELPTLFSAPFVPRTQVEGILAGLGDARHFQRANHTRDLVLSSRNSIVLGHLTDPQGFRRTDIMMMSMGLITPSNRIVPLGGRTSDLHVQRGAAIVHFYPGLGQEEGIWRLPCVKPGTSADAVSPELIKTRVPKPDDKYKQSAGSSEGPVSPQTTSPPYQPTSQCFNDSPSRPISPLPIVNHEAGPHCQPCGHPHFGSCPRSAQSPYPFSRPPSANFPQYLDDAATTIHGALEQQLASPADSVRELVYPSPAASVNLRQDDDDQDAPAITVSNTSNNDSPVSPSMPKLEEVTSGSEDSPPLRTPNVDFATNPFLEQHFSKLRARSDHEFEEERESRLTEWARLQDALQERRKQEREREYARDIEQSLNARLVGTLRRKRKMGKLAHEYRRVDVTSPARTSLFERSTTSRSTSISRSSRLPSPSLLSPLQLDRPVLPTSAERRSSVHHEPDPDSPPQTVAARQKGTREVLKETQLEGTTLADLDPFTLDLQGPQLSPIPFQEVQVHMAVTSTPRKRRDEKKESTDSPNLSDQSPSQTSSSPNSSTSHPPSLRTKGRTRSSRTTLTQPSAPLPQSTRSGRLVKKPQPLHLTTRPRSPSPIPLSPALPPPHPSRSSSSLVQEILKVASPNQSIDIQGESQTLLDTLDDATRPLEDGEMVDESAESETQRELDYPAEEESQMEPQDIVLETQDSIEPQSSSDMELSTPLLRPVPLFRPDMYHKDWNDQLEVIGEEGRVLKPREDDAGVPDSVIVKKGVFIPHMQRILRHPSLARLIPINRAGPRPDLSIPVQQRKYYPQNDQSPFLNIARAERILHIDLSTMHAPYSREDIPPAQMGIFTILAPADGPDSLVFPAQIWPESYGPNGLPPVTSSQLGQWFREMRKCRQKILGYIQGVRAHLSPWQIAQCESQCQTIFIFQGRNLVPRRVNRQFLFRVLHPTFNSLITDNESTFLRAACYHFRKTQQEEIASTIDNILRTPQYNEYLCRDLLVRGLLDDTSDAAEIRAMYCIESHDNLARGE